MQSLNLTVENSYGSLNINVISTPLVEDAWMPMTYNFKGGGSAMGLSAEFSFIGSVKYPSVELNTALTRPPILKAFSTTDTSKVSHPMVVFKTKKEEKNAKFLEEISKKEKLSTRDMIRLAKISASESEPKNLEGKQDLEIKDNRKIIVEKDAKLKDSAYWSTNRLIPLTVAESKAIRVDTAHQKAPVVKTDSTEKKDGPIKKAITALAFGKEITIKKPALTLGYNGLLDIRHLGYNTVDGAVVGQSVYAYWQADSIHRLEIKPSAQYAFARKAVMWQVGTSYTYAPFKRGRLEVNGGNHSTDFNQTSGIYPLLNGAYTLFFRQNYEKLVNNKFLSVRNQIDVANGLVAKTNLTYSISDTLSNNTDFSFFYKNSRLFTSNTPENLNYRDYNVPHYKAFVADVELAYTPHQFYRVNNGVKRVEYSNYPTFAVHYVGGLSNLIGSNSNFNFMEGSIRQNVKMAASNSIDYSVMGGGFLSKKSLNFTNFKHFNTENIIVAAGNLTNSFVLMDFYKYSSSSYFVEGHFQYSTHYLLLKMLPFFNKQLWSESLYVNYLTTEQIKNYSELGYGVNNIFFIGNLGAFASFENGKYKSFGLRLGLSFKVKFKSLSFKKTRHNGEFFCIFVAPIFSNASFTNSHHGYYFSIRNINNCLFCRFGGRW